MVTREHLSSLCYPVLLKGCSISIEGKENFWHIDSIDGEVRAFPLIAGSFPRSTIGQSRQ
jgi:hypothetical protein